jgi:hypothetical protein
MEQYVQQRSQRSSLKMLQRAADATVLGVFALFFDLAVFALRQRKHA